MKKITIFSIEGDTTTTSIIDRIKYYKYEVNRINLDSQVTRLDINIGNHYSEIQLQWENNEQRSIFEIMMASKLIIKSYLHI